MEIYRVRDVTHLEGNGKVAERFASKQLSCQLCAALKMPVAAHWLKELSCAAAAARIGLMLALGKMLQSHPEASPKNGGSSEATGFFIQASDHLIWY